MSIDDLLSGERLLSVAEKENRASIRRICGLLMGAADILAFVLIILPLYPRTVDGYVYSVSFPAYTEATLLNRAVCWAVYLVLILLEALRFPAEYGGDPRRLRMLTAVSVGCSVLTVLLLALAGETYAVAVVFLLLVIKGCLLYRRIRAA